MDIILQAMQAKDISRKLISSGFIEVTVSRKGWRRFIHDSRNLQAYYREGILRIGDKNGSLIDSFNWTGNEKKLFRTLNRLICEYPKKSVIYPKPTKKTPITEKLRRKILPHINGIKQIMNFNQILKIYQQNIALEQYKSYINQVRL